MVILVLPNEVNSLLCENNEGLNNPNAHGAIHAKERANVGD